MKVSALLLVTIGLVTATAAHAIPAPIITVDHLTCAGAIAYVKKYERYYVASRDGALPVYDVRPIGGNAYCKVHERMQYHAYPTLDNPHCHIAMSCVPF